MINKQVSSVAHAVADIPDGATVMVGGCGASGSPIELIHALIDQGATGLTVINNNTGNGEVGLAALIAFTLLITTIPADLISPETERAAIVTLTVAHIPLMVIEGIFTALLVLFLRQVKPELLGSA